MSGTVWFVPGLTAAALVLAGGGSRRMGGPDKLALDVAGRTVLDWVLAAARPLSQRLVVVGPVRPTAVAGVDFAEEAAPGGGPAAAVAAGVALLADADAVLILAGDLPLLSSIDLRRLLDRLSADPPVDAAAALDHRRLPNPLLAAYRMGVIPTAAAPGAAAATLLPERLATVELGPDATLNVNRPPDLGRAAALLRSRGAPASRGSPSPPEDGHRRRAP